MISLPLNLLLNVFGVVGRQAVRLELDVVVEFCQVLDEVVHCLRLLLLFRQRHLQDLPKHSVHTLSWVVGVVELLLDYKAGRFERALEGNLGGILHWLVGMGKGWELAISF